MRTDRSQTPSRRQWLANAAGGAALAAVAQQGQAQASRPPNFIVILADDQGYGDLGCYGSPYIRTPNIDRMAREGARLTDFYAQPLCGPSRAALLTGCYPVRNSLMFNHLPRAQTGIHPQEWTIAEVLKQRGYATCMAGKWHLGDAPPFLPVRHGFDSWLGLPYSNDMWPFHPKIQQHEGENPRLTAARDRATLTGYDGQGQVYPTDWFPDLPLMRNEERIELNPDQRTLTGRYTNHCLEFIRENRDRPFFVYLAHAMPHAPLFASKPFEGRSRRGLYGDVIEEIDANVGRVVKELESLGLAENTLILYTSDNGPWLPYGIDAGSAGPLRGGKGSVWEGGIRVPAVWYWPGKVRAGSVHSQITASIDILPTLAELAGTALPPHTIDGRSLWPMLSGANSATIHYDFYYYSVVLQYRAEQGRPENHHEIAAVRSGPWKLHLSANGEELKPEGLYHLPHDVGESFNLLNRHPGRAAEMLARAKAFDRRITAEARPLGRLE